jgi:hypothetical protein
LIGSLILAEVKDEAMNFNSPPSLLVPDPQDPSQDEDEDFNVVGGEIFATFSPWASWLSDGNPFAPSAVPALPTVGDGSAGVGDPGSTVAVTSGGITINLIFDTAAMAAPASFRAGIQQAVAILTAAISDKITVNLKIDYSGTGGGASAGPDHGVFQSYSSIRADLINNATPGDTSFNALAAGSTLQGQTNVAVWNAQLKLWGLMGANDTTTDDGSATFATDINPNLLVGVALHELTHAMGRVPFGPQPDIFDFFRFTSAGTRLFQAGATAPAAYFSLDGGNTKVADYGRTSDASDFLNSGVQGPSDPFNEFYNGSTSQQLTAADLKQLDALGFHLVTPDTQAPILVIDNSMSIQAGATQAITSTLLIAADNTSSAAQLRYTVTTGPAYGTLLLGGLATSSFTQGDINNGLVSYHETAAGVTSDAFSFRLSDAAGNTSATSSFQINISAFKFAGSGQFDHDGSSQTLLQDPATGLVAVLENSPGHVVANVPGGYQIAGAGDFNHDGTTDVLFQSPSSGFVAEWIMNAGHRSIEAGVGYAPSGFVVAGTGDFNHDGTSDIVFQNPANTAIAEWQINDGHVAVEFGIGLVPAGFKFAGTGDVNNDGVSDVLFQNPTNGAVAVWQMNAGRVAIEASVGVAPNGFKFAAAGDFNHDGTTDVLFQDPSTGNVAEWLLNAGHVAMELGVGVTPSGFQIAGVTDVNHDGTPDLLFQNASNGAVVAWEMQAGHVLAQVSVNWLIS